MKGNESEADTTKVFSAKQRSMSRRNAAKVAQSMSEAQQQAKMREIGSHVAAATTVSPEQQQAAVKAAMVHAWRGVSSTHDLTHLGTLCHSFRHLLLTPGSQRRIGKLQEGMQLTVNPEIHLRASCRSVLVIFTLSDRSFD